jgi:two-component system response regulator DesR
VIRVLLAEDQAMVRGALVSLIGLEADLQVVAEVGRGDEVLEVARRERPDVALLDIGLPGKDGLELAAQLHDELPAVRVVMLTTFNRPGYLSRAMQAGAVGFLLKDAPASELARTIRAAAAGEQTVDPGLAAAALSQGENPLTAREQEVLSEARRHGTVAELAGSLHLSAGTTRNHLSSIMQKLGVHSRMEAIRVAEERGWL